MHPKSVDQCLRVLLTNGTTNQIRFNDQTDFSSVISLITNRLSTESIERPLQSLYALRVTLPDKNGATSGPVSTFHHNTHVWLARNASVLDAFEHFDLQSPDVKVELRVRYFAYSFKEIFYKDRVTFYYLYDQVKNDYVQLSTSIDAGLAINLACLEIRRLFKEVPNFAIDKKSNFEYLEKEVGLHKFLPASVISSIKSKQLRKQIQSEFKSVGSFDECQCMIRFLDKVQDLLHFTEERFKCEFGTSWSVPVQLVIGIGVGISFQADSASDPTQMANLQQVQSIQINARPDTSNDSKCVLQLAISGALEPLCIICASSQQAEQIAELIDSYCCLVQRIPRSIWTRTGSDSPELTEVPIVPAEKDYAEIVEEEDDDYCTPAGPPPAHLQLDRQRVRLLDVIGEGQFGNVFRAEYQSPDTTRPMVVAVKTCKTESQAQMGGRFLQEAHAMSQLHHPHIIELIGVCAGQPTWLLIEFAALGQLRSYLITVRPNADTLLLYAQQLCDALTYLESRRFVHRDIAARNLLVATPECIKLADFGLSRLLHSDGCYYKAGRGKLPIKWMAPESINYRRFTSASDVWMFAVCLWEIFTHGIKPFAELKNSEVIVRLESGERLPPPPESCCSPRLYRLMLNCWSFQPTDRPTFAVLKHLLHEIGHEINDELELAESLEAVSCEPIDNVRKVAPRPVSQFVSPYSMIDAIGDQSTESESIGTETIEQLFLPENANPDESSLHSEYDTSSTTELSVKKRLENENEEEEAKVKSVERLESICRDSLEPDWTERSSFNRSLQMLSNEDDSDNLPSSEHTDLNVTEKRRSQTVPNSPAHSVCNISAPVEIGKGAQLLWSERLKRQQRQSAADAKWLHEEEQQMFGSNQSPGHGSSYSSLGSDLSGLSTQNMTDKKHSDDVAKLDSISQHEPVYVQTTQVLLAIKRLVEAVQHGATVRYLRLVRDVGTELRQLLALVDSMMAELPVWSHREVELAHKVLASDMTGLVRAMHQALGIQLSSLAAESRRAMCQAAHTIVVDSKTLLDTVNSVRARATVLVSE